MRDYTLSEDPNAMGKGKLTPLVSGTWKPYFLLTTGFDLITWTNSAFSSVKQTWDLMLVVCGKQEAPFLMESRQESVM